jgi:CrcB protein
MLDCLAVALGGASGSVLRYMIGLKSSINPRFVLFLKVGICGGFTTFSTFALESSNIIKSGYPGIGFVLLAELLIRK